LLVSLVCGAGFVDSTRRIIQTRQKIQEEGGKIPGLRVVGEPESSVVAFASDDFDIYRYRFSV
jgi:glutamate/tyrosine decarboxylase-like PLP-dependent enzyme